MQHLLWMILWDGSPGSSEGKLGLSNMLPGFCDRNFKNGNNVVSVWHEYCSDAMCPTLMDWQAR